MNKKILSIILLFVLSGVGITIFISNDSLQPGTAAMVEKLSQLRDEHLQYKGKADRYLFGSKKRIQYLEEKLLTRKNEKKILTQFFLALEYSCCGELEKSADLLIKTKKDIDEYPEMKKLKFFKKIDYLLVGNYLRLGEQDNCLCSDSEDTCLFPIKGQGIHSQRAGSQQAIAILIKILKEDASDLGARWLLNLAHMTLDQYPQQVPKKWLIPPQTFESEYDIQRFTNISAKAKVNPLSKAGGVIMDDFNNDGYMDIIASGWQLDEQIRFFINNGNRTFRECTQEAKLQGLTGGLHIAQADYNNDGHLDFFVARGAWQRQPPYPPNSLLKNNGDGTFSDVTVEAGLLSFYPTQTIAWGDYNNDGWIDLFVGNENRSAQGKKKSSKVAFSSLYRNNKDGTFSNVSQETGIQVNKFVKGASWGDIDNDGFQDLYISCRNEENLLLHNKRGKRFEDIALQKNVQKPIRSFPIWFWDYNNDGWLDILVASFNSNFEITQEGRSALSEITAFYLRKPNVLQHVNLYKNDCGNFINVAKETKISRAFTTMGANFGDIDNDGFLDAYFGTGDPFYHTLIPNKMLRNDKGKVFQDVTTSGGFGHLQKGHGIAFGDIDNDGDSDVYAQLGGAYEGDKFYDALFENPGNQNNWVTLRLQGTKSNRSAIGTRIRVDVITKEGNTQSFYHVVSSGGSFGSSSLQQEIGLGRVQKITKIELDWPASQTKQVFSTVDVNCIYLVREGNQQMQKLH